MDSNFDLPWGLEVGGSRQVAGGFSWAGGGGGGGTGENCGTQLCREL